MTQWINELVTWLETTSVHQTMQTVEWAVPAVQTIHILAIAAVFASSLALSLRTLQLAGSDWSPAQWGRRLDGWIGWGLAVLLVSGVTMICGEPARSLNNFLFQTKMLLLLVAIALFLALSRSVRGLVQPEQRTPGGVRLLAILLVSVWIAIIICGRWIAYT
ncbi:DUF6644 family protein [Sphingobium nicotianae]|uniref:DUF6644 domain-containing protein n=1 Tax=Sphingobium nicotianae TaxID=2782607 RepID=A0A9X1D9Z9_9SPHN|nr:DUF6644 family protein [Sphingobium nicotianae]MBT2186139.1 hypothetical protein [Sphingobium nicotianae]